MSHIRSRARVERVAAMAVSTAIIKLTNKIFPKVVHPFNLQNEGKETYAQWQFRKGGDTIKFFLFYSPTK